MSTLTFLRNADYVVTILVNVAVLCFAFPAYRRTKMLAFGCLIWASVLGILLESGYVLHSSNSSSASDTLSFLQLYRIGIIIYDILFCIGVIQLIQHFLSEMERKTIEPGVTVPPAMTLKPFRTNVRLWLFVSVILFVLPWFIMDIGTGGDDIKHPIQLWFGLFSRDANSGPVGSRIFAFTLLFGISALVIGWVVQCLIIVVQDICGQKKRNDD
jgi:hypothetical protein